MRFYFLVFSLGCSLFAYSTPVEYESVVENTRPSSEPEALTISPSPSQFQPWLSLSEGGLSALPSAGALSPTTLRAKGFSATQLKAQIDGIDIADASTGLIDPHDLPLFAADQVEVGSPGADQALGGSLRLSLVVPEKAFARGRATFASHNLALADAVAGSGDWLDSRALIGAQWGQTQGNFKFALQDSQGERSFVRENNDQLHQMGFIKTEHRLSPVTLTLFAYARNHEGGLAGPAPFPTPTLRLNTQKAIASAALRSRIDAFDLSLAWNTRYDHRESWHTDADDHDAINAITHKLAFKGERRFLLGDTFASTEHSFDASELMGREFRRQHLGSEFFVDTAPLHSVPLRVKQSAHVQFYSDAGWLFGFRSNLAYAFNKELTLGALAGKASRAPTLSELFAPSGLVLGNAKLKPEDAWEAGLYGAFDDGDRLQLKTEFFYNFLERAIFYVNKNAFVLEPMNADHVHRAGVGTTVVYTPTPYFESRTRVDWLFTRMGSGAPLPGASPLAISINARIGKEDKLHGRISTLMNAGASSNLFGTLKTAPYGLFNASLHLPIFDFARLSLAVTNIADIKRAQSAYHYPLPGREFSVSLEAFSS